MRGCGAHVCPLGRCHAPSGSGAGRACPWPYIQGGAVMESRHFGALLRRHRMRVRMTQQQLADFSTLSVRAIRDLERGHAQRPRQDTVRLLAEVLRLGGHDREEFDLASRGVAEDLVAGRFTPPVPPATIVGREEELRVLTDLLTVEGQRLVAVVGVAGVGKTRLMLDVA